MLSMFFPMWNEEAYIERALGYAKEECELLIAGGQILDYELIVVDDASTDNTPQMAAAMAAADPRVKVVHHPVNRKLGGSIKSGFAAATGDIVLYSDADLPFDMAEVGQAVRLMRYSTPTSSAPFATTVPAKAAAGPSTRFSTTS